MDLGSNVNSRQRYLMGIFFFFSYSLHSAVDRLNHVVQKEQMGSGLLLPAVMFLLHVFSKECKCASGAEPPRVFQ